MSSGAAGPRPELDDLVAPIRRDPSSTVLLFDFDGTLSPTVLDPARAQLVPGAFERLDALARRYRTVGAVSGRPVAFLAERLPPSLVLSGEYGLDVIVDGEPVARPELDRWRAALDEAVAHARRIAPDGLRVEPKGLTATLHYRGRPDLEEPAAEVAALVAGPVGLVARPARQSIELVPPVITTKGDEVARLSAGASAALFAGDDIGDLPGFEALAHLRASGAATLAVAVASDETPAALRAGADLVLPETAAVLGLLDALLA